jgi:hypothetical protein
VVTGDIMALLDRSLPSAESLMSGEAVVFVDAHDPDLISGDAVADRDVIPVTVPLYTEDVQKTWRGDESASIRRARIATHIATAAYHQGGIMSVAKLAELLHVRPSTMSKDLRDLAVEVHNQAPTKGLIEDAGPTVTHKAWIVDLDRYGLTGQEISWLTRHAPVSRDRYIGTYRRAEALMVAEGKIPDVDYMARILRLRPHVAKQYRDLLQRYWPDGDCIPDSAHPA